MSAIAFTIADKNNIHHAEKMINSLHKFHPELEVRVYKEEDIGDPINYYRSTPMFARLLIKKYDTVIKLDADQIITGNLDHVLNSKYDVGVVMNYNRVDPPKYGPVGVFDIVPQEYMNCGFVVLKSERFLLKWWQLCNSAHFMNLPYKEQDLLNILIHYGDYKVECFDYPNGIKNYHAWHGLISKGEYHRMEMRDGKLILPGAADGYPECDKEIKVLHAAGGGNEKRIGDSYRLFFNEECIKYIDGLVK